MLRSIFFGMLTVLLAHSLSKTKMVFFSSLTFKFLQDDAFDSLECWENSAEEVFKMLIWNKCTESKATLVENLVQDY